jgi:hypothetical protein
LPTSTEIFQRYFAPQYPEGRLEERGYPAVAPLGLRLPQHLSSNDLSGLTPEYERFVRAQVEGLTEAAKGDFASFLSVSGEPTMEWIQAFDSFFTESALQSVIDDSEPGEYGAQAPVLIGEIGSLMGNYLVKSGKCHWVYEYPYWDSWLYFPEKGMQVNIYALAMTKFSSEGLHQRLDGMLAAIETFEMPTY